MCRGHGGRGGRGCATTASAASWVGAGRGPVEAEQLEPADQVGGETDQGQPGLVGVEVAEGEPFQAGRFEPADVVLDMGVGSHVGVQGDRVAGLVGVMPQ